MKKLTKILILVLSVALILGAFVLAASAADEAPEATTHVAFVVTNAEGSAVNTANAVDGKDANGKDVKGYTTLSDAVAAAKTVKNATITMVNDYEMGVAVTALIINQDMTLDFNGYTLAISYNRKDGSYLSYQVITISSGATFTLTGNGTLKTSIAWMPNGGTLVVDSGEGKTFNLEAVAGYEYKTATATAVKGGFSGQPLIKIGANTNNNNSASKAILRGNIKCDSSSLSGMVMIGAYAGGFIELDGVNLDATLGASGTLIAQNSLKATSTVTKDYQGAHITVKDSVINCPYGKVVDLTNAREIANVAEANNFTRATTVDITNTVIDANGNGKNGGTIFQISYNLQAYIQVTDSKIIADESVIQGAAQAVPNSLIIFKNSYIDTAVSAGTQYFINNGATVILDNSFVRQNAGDTAFNNGYAFTTAAQMPEGTALPRYADPAYATEEWYVGGFGNLVKNGSVVSLAATPGAPATWISGGSAFAVEGGATLVNSLYEYEGSLYSVQKVSDKKMSYEVGGNSNQYASGFESINLGGEDKVSYVEQQGSTPFDSFSVITIGKRTGKYSAVKTLGADNQYITHEHYYSANTAANTAYINIQNVNYPIIDATTGKVTPSTTKNIEDYKYYVLDLDLMTPTGDFADIGFTFYYTAWQSKLNSSSGKYVSDHVIFDNGAVQLTGTKGTATLNGKQFDVVPGEWNHFTFILEVPLDEAGKPDVTKMNESDIHVYMNGEFFTKRENVYKATNNYDPAKTNLFYEGKLDNTHMDEVRINFPKSTASSPATENTAFDNITLKQYFLDAPETKEEIANEYKQFTRPDALPVAEFDQTYYYDMEEALTDAFWWAEEEDATIELLTDCKGFINPNDYTDYFGDYTLTVITNGFDFKLDPDSGYVMDDNGDGSVTVRTISDGDYVDVTWVDNNGETIDTTTVLKGMSLTAPEAEAAVLETTYYTAIYDGWAVVGEENVLTPIDINEFTTATDVTIKQIVKTIDATVNNAYLNYEIKDNMRIMFYVPAELANSTGDKAIDNITFGTLKVNNAARPCNKAGTFAGKEYVFADSFPDFRYFTAIYPLSVEYTVTLDGIEYPLVERFTASAHMYCDTVLGAAEGKFTAEEKTYIANFVRYANVFNRTYNKGVYDTTINALYTKYASLCTEYEKDLLNATTVDPTNLAPYIESAYVAIVNGRAQYVIEFAKDSKVTDVTIAKDGYVEGASAAYGGIVLSKAPAERQWMFPNDGSANPVRGNAANASAYYATFYTENVRPFNFFGELTITFTLEGGNKVTGTYDLNTWYNGTEFAEGEKELWADLFMALKELADSQSAYRFKVVE